MKREFKIQIPSLTILAIEWVYKDSRIVMILISLYNNASYCNYLCDTYRVTLAPARIFIVLNIDVHSLDYRTVVKLRFEVNFPKYKYAPVIQLYCLSKSFSNSLTVWSDLFQVMLLSTN